MNFQELCQTFVNLRKRWPSDWPGLTFVVNSALAKLGHVQGAPLQPRLQALLDCVLLVSECVERDGAKRAKNSQEPSYHSRLHIADTIVAMTALLRAQRLANGHSPHSPLSRHEWQMFLAICSHDLFHSGKINQYAAQIEGQSVASLVPLMQKCKVHAADQRAIRRMILQTDPAMVKGSHLRVRSIAFSEKSLPCQIVMVQEADIMASSLPTIGDDLTQKLSQEWREVDPLRSKSLLSKQARIFFLKEFALFSSPASRYLGIQTVIDHQIHALTQASSRA
jgi:hypothetical protein